MLVTVSHPPSQSLLSIMLVTVTHLTSQSMLGIMLVTVTHPHSQSMLVDVEAVFSIKAGFKIPSLIVTFVLKIIMLVTVTHPHSQSMLVITHCLSRYVHDYALIPYTDSQSALLA